MANSIKHFFVLCLLFYATASFAQNRKIYTGITAGWQHSAFQFRKTENVYVNNGAWRAALLADYEITRRLSLSTQLGVQRINAVSILQNGNYTLNYPELWIGLTEYVPVGGGSLFFTGSLHAGYGFAEKGTLGVNVFDNKEYNRFRSGFAFLMGYTFRNGFFVNTGVQASSFTDYYKSPSGRGMYDFSVHAISLGYMFRTKERNRARSHY